MQPFHFFFALNSGGQVAHLLRSLCFVEVQVKWCLHRIEPLVVGAGVYFTCDTEIIQTHKHHKGEILNKH